MILHLKYNYQEIVTLHLTSFLQQNNITYKIQDFNEIKILKMPPHIDLIALNAKLNKNGIEIIENHKLILVQRIKSCIFDMLQNPRDITVKTSIYLSEKLEHNYNYISAVFCEVTYTSIENFIIIQKIEFVKQLIINNQLTLTEIAFKFNYSSVAHLSTQFKNTTGITPSNFIKIIQKRQIEAHKNNIL